MMKELRERVSFVNKGHLEYAYFCFLVACVFVCRFAARFETECVDLQLYLWHLGLKTTCTTDWHFGRTCTITIEYMNERT